MAHHDQHLAKDQSLIACRDTMQITITKIQAALADKKVSLAME